MDPEKGEVQIQSYRKSIGVFTSTGRHHKTKEVLDEWDQLTQQEDYFNSDTFRESIKHGRKLE